MFKKGDKLINKNGEIKYEVLSSRTDQHEMIVPGGTQPSGVTTGSYSVFVPVTVYECYDLQKNHVEHITEFFLRTFKRKPINYNKVWATLNV